MEPSPFFGAEWSLVAVELWLVAVVALVAVAVALRRASHPGLGWSLWTAGAVVLGASAAVVAGSPCNRALAGPSLSWSDPFTTCARVQDLQRSVLLTAAVLLPCLAVLAVLAVRADRAAGARTAAGHRVSRAAVAALLAATAVATGTLLLAGEDRVDDGTTDPTVLVAAGHILDGTSVDDALHSGHLEATPVPARLVLPGAVGDVRALGGQVFARDVYPGEQITTSVVRRP